ncbi:MAG: hypothetical protein LBE98_02400 [Puniceicoccales bacterium]|jgi:DNA-binding XRE family transcriptional regulator|nr:hypothetical protein [Puniceicoccales bacterium]
MDMISCVDYYSRLQQVVPPQQPAQPQQVVPSQQAIPLEEPIPLEEDNVIPEYFGNLSLNTLLNNTGRSVKSMRYSSYKDSGFNAILEQVGGRTSSWEMVDALRKRLGYDGSRFDEELNMDRDTCVNITKCFNCPIAEIYYNEDGKLEMLVFTMPNVDQVMIIERSVQLSQNFAQWCKHFRKTPHDIETELEWLKTCLPGPLDFRKATVCDIMLRLLRRPETIVITAKDSIGNYERFDAAPHKYLMSRDDVLDVELIQDIQVDEWE